MKRGGIKQTIYKFINLCNQWVLETLKDTHKHINGYGNKANGYKLTYIHKQTNDPLLTTTT